jgi:hypothetical protein
MKQITRRQFVAKSSMVASGLIGAHAMGVPEGDFRDFEKIQSWALKKAWPSLLTS